MPRTLLVVDDVLVNREILKRILSTEYRILEAGNGQEALEIMHRSYKLISAVLLDLVMPVADGYEVLRQMRKSPVLSQLPVIVTTGSAQEDSEFKALTLGANDYIIKPYNAAIIRQRIRNMIKLRETSATVNALQRDKLTGIYNREAFIEKVAWMVRGHEAGFYTMSCLNIDNFKVINDQYGTEMGDGVLKHVARCISRSMDALGGVCCRVMADNFAAVFPSSRAGSTVLSDAHRDAMHPDCINRSISIRIGRYCIDDLSLLPSAMYDRAALAEASIKGRADVSSAQYVEAMREHLLHEQKLVTEMDAALQSGQFEPWFQPQYNHATGALIGAEALVRWRHPDDGLLIPPGDFIPVFERNGFIYKLDQYIWEQVCILLRRWIDEGRSPLPVSVNISRYDLFRDDFYRIITGLVSKYNLPVHLLRLEVTESAFATSSTPIIAMVRQLIAFGFTVEIDDFGSGYSSLNTLKDVPASILKLDMKFLETSEDSERGGNILESVVRMAKWLGMSVIAEGVETREQAEYLKSIGCFYVQGYLYGKPMPLADYEALAGGSQKQHEMIPLVTVETLDNNTFWDPKSMDTLIFNSYVGGACILEYHNGNVELLRINERYARELCGEAVPDLHSPQILDLLRYADEENRAILMDGVRRAIESGAETDCECRLCGVVEEDVSTYLRVTIRTIARTGDRYLLYSSVFNLTAQREAERKALAVAAQTQMILQNLNGGVSAVIFQKGCARHIFANDRYYEIFGYTQDLFLRELPNGVVDLIHPDDRAAVFSVAEQAEADGQPFQVEFRARKRDGTEIFLRTKGSFCRIESYQTPVHLSVSYDVTREKEAERKIAFLNRTVVDLMNDTPGGFVRMQRLADGRIVPVYVNEGFCRLTGMTQQEVLSNYAQSALWGVHPDDIPVVEDAVGRMLKSGEARSARYRLLHKNGSYVWFMIFGRASTGDAGETYLNVYYTEMPEQERWELSQREMLPAALAALLESSTDLAFVKDASLSYVCCSRAFARMLGLAHEQDVRGKTDRDLFEDAGLAERYRVDDLQILQEGKAMVDRVEPIPSDDGMSHYSTTSKYPLRDSLGNVIGIYGVGRDVTEYHAAFERLKLLTNSIPGGLATYEIAPDHLRLRYFSDGYCTRFGYTREEYQKMTDGDPLGTALPEDRLTIREAAALALSGGLDFHHEYRARCKDGNFRWIDLRCVVIERHGDTAIVNVVKFDVTERKLYEEQLRMREEQYRLAQAHSGTILCRYDVADRAVIMSSEVAAVFGMAERVEDVPYAPVRLGRIAPGSADDYIAFYESIRRGAKTGEGEFECLLATGWRRLRGKFSTIFSDAGEPVNAVVSFLDVTEEHLHAREREQLLQLAETDGMTGVYNKRTTEERIRQKLAESRGTPCALLIVDIDNLKAINDALGHPEGDKAICLLADAVQKQFRSTDVVGRIGGDEFLVFLDGLGERAKIRRLLLSLIERCAGARVGPQAETPLSVSIGATVGTMGDFTFEELYDRADKALYFAKRNGKKQLSFFLPEMDEPAGK